MSQNENENDNGLHIVVVNPWSGNVDLAKAFDTNETSKYFDHFIKSANFPDDYIIIAACKSDCFTKLSYNAKKWFCTMCGSKEIWNLRGK